MIPVAHVHDAVLVVLRTTGLDVGDLTAPPGNLAVYGVLEHPPGTQRVGTVAIPEQGATVRVRIRGVARSKTPGTARTAAQDVAHRLGAALLDRAVPIAGTGWECVGRTHVVDSGLDLQGEVANTVDDYDLDIAKA